MIFSTPVTPTRERLTSVLGRRAWTSLPRSAVGSFMATANCTCKAHWGKSHERVYTGRRGSTPSRYIWPNWLSPSRRPRDQQLHLATRLAPVAGVFV